MRMPFKSQAFDLIICHHSLEHFPDADAVIKEIARVLKPTGRLFVSVPDGRSFSDGLYRLLLAGGGHLQKYTFDDLVGRVESRTGLRLVAWKRLYTSFIYLEKRNFVPAPLGALPGPLPRRMRWVGLLPSGLITAIKVCLNVATRLSDRYARSNLSTYGWAFAFDASGGNPVEERSTRNVCMACGHGFEVGELTAFGFSQMYTCARCGALNPFFGEISSSTD
jgi:SAM-dependent methyltransferase